MDEEDRAEAAASRTLQVVDTATLTGLTADDPHRKDAIGDMFKSSVNTAAVRAMKKLGWREGSVGTLPAVPRGPPTRTGLGYNKGAAPLPSLDGSMADIKAEDEQPDQGVPTQIGKPKRVNRKTAMGTGVLDDDSDEDPYSMGPKLSLGRKAVAKKAKKPISSSPAVRTIANPKLASRPMFRSKAQTSTSRSFDGRLPLLSFQVVGDIHEISRKLLECFKVDRKSVAVRVPSDWQPARTRESSKSDVAGQHGMANPDIRAQTMGWGRTLKGPSIWSMISPETRDRIAAATGRTDLPPASGPSSSAPSHAEVPSISHARWKTHNDTPTVPQVSKETALAVLGRIARGWRPYTEDESKQERYGHYLEYCSGKEADPHARPFNPADHQSLQELREFARSSEVFKPMSGMMASRFMTSSSGAAANDKLQESKEPADPAEAAAKASMYGELTRRTFRFHPVSLLCKRFGILQPAPPEEGDGDDQRQGQAESQGRPTRALLSKEMMEQLRQEAGLPSRERVQIDEMHDEALTGQKADREVLKSIFD